ncbi:44595_t:CDS:2, partial [Gigaspora margarita]
AKEVSEASQHWMDDFGKTRIGHKPDFQIKSPLIVDEVEICLMEASQKLTRGKAGKIKDLEEEFNKVPVFGIQVADRTLACWVMTMPFSAFYFVQHLVSIQIPMNQRQFSLTEFMNELWKLRTTLQNHVHVLNEIIEKVDSSLYNIAICSSQAREDVPLMIGVNNSTITITNTGIKTKLNAKLLADIAELRKKNAKIPDLRRMFAEIEAKRTELKARIARLLRQSVEENKMHDAKNAKLKTRIEELKYENVEFRDRITKVKKRQLQNDNITKVTNSSINSSSNFNLVTKQLPMKVYSKKSLEDIAQYKLNCKTVDTNSKALEEKETDKTYKESISASTSSTNISETNKVVVDNIAEKTAKSQVYTMIKAFLPKVLEMNLRKKTQRARSVYKLFEKIIDPTTKKEVKEISIDKAYGISYEKSYDTITVNYDQNNVTEILPKRDKIAFKLRDNNNYWKKEHESISQADFLEYKKNFKAKMGVPTTPYKKELKNKPLALIEYA